MLDMAKRVLTGKISFI